MDNLTLKDVLNIAVETEKLGEQFYDNLQEKFKDDPDLSKMFKMLAEDEVEHEKQFKALLHKYETDNTPIEGLNREFLEAVDLRKFFERLGNIPDNPDVEDVLRLAFSLEKEAVLFFSGIREVTGPNDEIEKIIDIERGHMTRIMKYIINDSKFRGIKDSWI